jgi:hypothetical protein
MEADITATVMLFCLMKYWDFRDTTQGKVVPKRLVEVQHEVKQQTNHLANFLANGDDFYDILFDRDYQQTTKLEDLQKAFQKLSEAKSR